MKDFLEKLHISKTAISIYLQCFGKSPLTYYEIHSSTPNLNQNEFARALEELVNVELFVRVEPQDPESLLHFWAIPPFKPILNYYNNINNKKSDIIQQILEFIEKSLKQTLQENTEIEMNTLYDQFMEMKEDIEEDNLIQKQEVEDIVESTKELDDIKKHLSTLQDKVKITVSSKFANLLGVIEQSKNNIIEKVQSIKIKKVEEELTTFVEEELKTKIDQLIEEFTSKLNDIIDDVFNEHGKPINDITNVALQGRNDYKLLFLSGMSNFEVKLKNIHDSIKFNKSNFDKGLKNLGNAIMENIKTNIQNSIDQISSLNTPIENGIKQSFQKIKEKKPELNNLWLINSKTKLKEEILSIIGNSKIDLQVVVPKLE